MHFEHRAQPLTYSAVATVTQLHLLPFAQRALSQVCYQDHQPEHRRAAVADSKHSKVNAVVMVTVWLGYLNAYRISLRCRKVEGNENIKVLNLSTIKQWQLCRGGRGRVLGRVLWRPRTRPRPPSFTAAQPCCSPTGLCRRFPCTFLQVSCTKSKCWRLPTRRGTCDCFAALLKCRSHAIPAIAMLTTLERRRLGGP